MALSDSLAAVQADLTQLQADLNALAKDVQGLDAVTTIATLAAQQQNLQDTITALAGPVTALVPDGAAAQQAQQAQQQVPSGP